MEAVESVLGVKTASYLPSKRDTGRERWNPIPSSFRLEECAGACHCEASGDSFPQQTESVWPDLFGVGFLFLACVSVFILCTRSELCFFPSPLCSRMCLMCEHSLPVAAWRPQGPTRSSNGLRLACGVSALLGPN